MYTPRTVVAHRDVLYGSGACAYDIEDLLYAYGWTGRLTGWGEWKRTRCPFHDDRSPSASVNLDVNAFKCWGCGITGDTITLLMELEGLDKDAAIARLGDPDDDLDPKPKLPWR